MLVIKGSFIKHIYYSQNRRNIPAKRVINQTTVGK